MSENCEKIPKIVIDSFTFSSPSLLVDQNERNQSNQQHWTKLKNHNCVVKYPKNYLNKLETENEEIWAVKLEEDFQLTSELEENIQIEQVNLNKKQTQYLQSIGKEIKTFIEEAEKPDNFLETYREMEQTAHNNLTTKKDFTRKIGIFKSKPPRQ